MMAEVGLEIRNVTGRRREMAATGPNPGRTPTRVPMVAPTKQNKRLIGCRQTEKPYKIFWTISIRRNLLFGIDNPSLFPWEAGFVAKHKIIGSTQLPQERSSLLLLSISAVR
jgi:hypothetical protein